MIIAIDGPAASGKSTTAKLVAERLGFLHIDTGAMYRGVTLYLLDHEIPLNDLNQVVASLDEMQMSFTGKGHLVLNDRNVARRIRTKRIDRNVSAVSAIPQVREKLVERQRQFASDHNIVMEGRDIGTRVFPQADIKIFIQADVEVRSQRRFLEMKAKGENPDPESVLADLKRRDHIDSTREHSPLEKAVDAVVIDTTHLSIEDQVAEIVKLVHE